jgi:hypothetical protein
MAILQDLRASDPAWAQGLLYLGVLPQLDPG